ncbi:MAG: 2-hydroxyacid dehydrogenase [Syntrophobacteraceae bacterium]|jgi:phosphoglycerate dehydrogenase-like enzyme|nr:2-hydroxyacid dehydrogenase [Syntrophobacteraceae bacterium]
MNVLFAAHEDAWGGFLHGIRAELPDVDLEAAGSFEIHSLRGFDVLIPTMSRITRDLLETADRLKLIQQCGAGLEGVDIVAARDQGIQVANVPTDISGNADSVAELAIYLMIGLSRDARGMARSLEAGRMGEPRGRALSGKTVGIVGLGGIGRALTQRLRGFDVRMIGVRRRDPDQDPRLGDLGLEWVGAREDLYELLDRSDYVVLSLPLTPETYHLMDERSLARMKPDAYLINVSRGGLVDRDALEHALASGVIAGAGLDVFWDEPPDPRDALFRHNVLATPHVAGSTDTSIRGIVKVVAENIRRIEQGIEPRFCVC